MRLSKFVATSAALGCAYSAFSGAPATAFQTINVAYTWTGIEATQGTERLFRDASPSVAGTQKAFPGTFSQIPTYFYVQAFQALPGSIVTVQQNSANSIQSFTSLYSGDSPFDPANLANGYLGDAGSSGPSTFQINANGSGKLLFIGNSVSANPIGQLLDATITYTPSTPSQVPGPLPLLGAATAFSFSRKLRKRCKKRVAVTSN